MVRVLWLGSIAAVVALVITLTSATAADPPTQPVTPQHYGQIASNLFELAADNKVDEAVRFSQVSDRISREAADRLRENLARPAQKGWKYINSEVAASKTITSRVHELYVMAHYDQCPVLVIFRFYNGNDGWFIQSFRFRHDLDDFIDSLPYDRVQHREGR